MTDPFRLVEAGTRRYGRFPSPPSAANPLDEFRGPSRLLLRARLKEWVGFGLTHPDWYFAFIMQDAQYLATSAVYAFDRRRRVVHEYAGARRGGSLSLPSQLLEECCAFRSRGYELTFEFSRTIGRHRVRFDLAESRRAPSFRGALELDARRASPPLVVSARLASGGPIYTHKAIFPVTGALHVGGDVIVFDPSRDLAILDEHKSFFPYRTRWQWGTFAMHTPAGLVGANFADHEMTPGDAEESCVWTPRACEPLAGVRFVQHGADPMATWHVSSADGRLDVTFEPEGRKQERRNFGVAALDYFQLCGHFSGTLRSYDQSYSIDRVYGVCERMRARF